MLGKLYFSWKISLRFIWIFLWFWNFQTWSALKEVSYCLLLSCKLGQKPIFSTRFVIISVFICSSYAFLCYSLLKSTRIEDFHQLLRVFGLLLLLTRAVITLASWENWFYPYKKQEQVPVKKKDVSNHGLILLSPLDNTCWPQAEVDLWAEETTI